jgi:hypothetical protein
MPASRDEFYNGKKKKNGGEVGNRTREVKVGEKEKGKKQKNTEVKSGIEQGRMFEQNKKKGESTATTKRARISSMESGGG